MGRCPQRVNGVRRFARAEKEEKRKTKTHDTTGGRAGKGGRQQRPSRERYGGGNGCLLSKSPESSDVRCCFLLFVCVGVL